MRAPRWALVSLPWPASREERLMFAGARLRVIRTAIWVGWASLAAIFAVTAFHSQHIERTHHLPIWLLLGAAVAFHAVMFIVPWRRLATRRVSELLLYAWVGAVLGFVAILLYLAGPYSSDFYLVYLPLLLFAAAAFNARVYAVIVVLVASSYLGVASLGGASLPDLTLRLAAILLTAALAGYLAGEQRAKARSIALLHEALLDVSGERDRVSVLRSVTRWARRLADGNAAIWVPPPESPEPPVTDPAGVDIDAGTPPIEGSDRAAGPVLLGGGPDALVLLPLGGHGTLVVRGPAGAFSATQQYMVETLAAEATVTLESIRLTEDLRHKERARADLLARLISAQEEERRRIARELHDGTSQDLAGLVVGLEALQRRPETVDTSELKKIARSVADELRRVILDLRPRVLDDLGLAAALRWLANERHDGPRIEVDVPAELPIDPPLDTAVFRIVQEAITNVERHAGASRVWLRLGLEDGEIRVVIEDDGQGFDPDRVTNGLGLLGMQERAEQLGGRLEVAPREGGGTLVSVEIPLRA